MKMLGTSRIINPGNHLTPCLRQAVQEPPNQANSQVIAHQARKHRSKYAAHRGRSGPLDAGVLTRREPHPLVCRTNAHSVLRSSRLSMIGNVMRSHFIYLWRDGSAHSKALALPRSRSETNAVSSAAKCDRMRSISKRTTTLHARKEACKNVPSIGKITSSNICAWCTASNSPSGRWRAGCCLYLTSDQDADFAVLP